MNMEKLMSVLAVLLALVAVGVAIFAVNSQTEVVVPSADEIASKVNVSVVQEVVDNSRLDELYEDYFKARNEAELQNNTAKDLVMEEIAKKAFKLAILDALEAEGKDVDSYKDITITSASIKESVLSGESAVVTVTLRVSFIEFGDELESFRAVIEAVFEVEGLDVEDFEDAEVVDYDLEVLRIREN